MTQDEIIALAKASLNKDVIYHRDGIELEWADLIDFFHAAQRQAYERAAKVCEKEAVDPHNVPAAIVARRCSAAIRALIEGDE